MAPTNTKLSITSTISLTLQPEENTISFPDLLILGPRKAESEMNGKFNFFQPLFRTAMMPGRLRYSDILVKKEKCLLTCQHTWFQKETAKHQVPHLPLNFLPMSRFSPEFSEAASFWKEQTVRTLKCVAQTN